MSNKKIYKYPDPNKVEINISDLRIKLQEFKGAVRRKLSLPDIFIIGAAWIPIFTSDFNKSIGAFSGGQILGFYVAIIGFSTIFWLFSGKNSIFYPILSVVQYIFDTNSWDKKHIIRFEVWVREWLRRNETDPQKKVKSIKKECN